MSPIFESGLAVIAFKPKSVASIPLGCGLRLDLDLMFSPIHRRNRVTWSEHKLGMTRQIPRRDFLQGMAVGAIGALSTSELAAMGLQEGHYPPALTGLRGSHPGSFESPHLVVHKLQDHQFLPAVISAKTFALFH